VADLKKEEIDAIRLKHCGEFLDNGWYFDGSCYMTFDGDRTYEHPNLQLLLTNYLEVENSSIGSYNRVVDKEWKDSLAKYE
jgi:hypothetical protein